MKEKGDAPLHTQGEVKANKNPLLMGEHPKLRLCRLRLKNKVPAKGNNNLVTININSCLFLWSTPICVKSQNKKKQGNRKHNQIPKCGQEPYNRMSGATYELNQKLTYELQKVRLMFLEMSLLEIEANDQRLVKNGVP